MVYGENLEKLKGIKMRLDPANRFNKGIDLVKC
jgi:FAD/FMN-containing dehydrogenase